MGVQGAVRGFFLRPRACLSAGGEDLNPIRGLPLLGAHPVLAKLMTTRGEGLDFAAQHAVHTWMGLDDLLDALEIADWQQSWAKAMHERMKAAQNG